MSDSLKDILPEIKNGVDTRHRAALLKFLDPDIDVNIHGDWISKVKEKKLEQHEIKDAMNRRQIPAKNEVLVSDKFMVYESDALTFKLIQDMDHEVLSKSYFLVLDTHLDKDNERQVIDLGTFRRHLIELGLIDTHQIAIVSRDSKADYKNATKFEGKKIRTFPVGKASSFLAIDLDVFYSDKSDDKELSQEFINFIDEKRKEVKANRGMFFVMVDVDVAGEDLQPADFTRHKVSDNPVIQNLTSEADKVMICLSLDLNKNNPDLPFDEALLWLNI
jgi:hypothetical protein